MLYNSYIRVSDIKSAIEILDKKRSEKPILLAGGTDIVNNIRKSAVKPGILVDISQIPELKQISDTDKKVIIGSAVTFSEIIESPVIASGFPLLIQACEKIGAPQIRNMGTIGGNICTASGAADLVPCLMALNAEVVLAGAKGERCIPLEDFILGNRKTALNPDELLISVKIRKLPDDYSGVFLKLGQRASQAISIVNVAVVMMMREGKISDARIVAGCVGPKAILCTESCNTLIGRSPSQELFNTVGELVLEEITPISDIRGSDAFRNHIARVLITRALECAYDNFNKAEGNE